MSWKGMGRGKGRHRRKVTDMVLFITVVVILAFSCVRLLQIWSAYRKAAGEYDALRTEYTRAIHGEGQGLAENRISGSGEGPEETETENAEETGNYAENGGTEEVRENSRTGGSQSTENRSPAEENMETTTEITSVPDALIPDKTGVPETSASVEEGDVTVKQSACPPLQADFDALKNVNPDIKGWIFISCLGLSYPVVQGEDNSRYLHHTAEGSYSFAGSIFMDFRNNPDYSDPNTILYGHNMKDGSMFGRLDEILSRKLYEEDPYFWVINPEGSGRYEIFSMFTSGISGECFRIFDGIEGAEDSFPTWEENMASHSEMLSGARSFSVNDKVVTLVTCTADLSIRMVVQGILETFIPAGS